MLNKVEICGVNTGTLPVISNDKMRVLFTEMQKGNKNARTEIISGNLRLVLSVIQKFNTRGENPDDLFQVGCIGLMKAVDNFDLSQNVRFSTYAVPMKVIRRKFIKEEQKALIYFQLFYLLWVFVQYLPMLLLPRFLNHSQKCHNVFARFVCHKLWLLIRNWQKNYVYQD